MYALQGVKFPIDQRSYLILILAFTARKWYGNLWIGLPHKPLNQAKHLPDFGMDRFFNAVQSLSMSVNIADTLLSNFGHL